MSLQDELQRLLGNLKDQIRDVDDTVSILREASGPSRADAYDHLQQIHYRLTEIKGHLGAVSYDFAKSKK